ncbi:MAG: hypothetical protein AAGD09_16185 [Cyanobacteria bacterium P01_F01_bin.56]
MAVTHHSRRNPAWAQAILKLPEMGKGDSPQNLAHWVRGEKQAQALRH